MIDLVIIFTFIAFVFILCPYFLVLKPVANYINKYKEKNTGKKVCLACYAGGGFMIAFRSMTSLNGGATIGMWLLSFPIWLILGIIIDFIVIFYIQKKINPNIKAELKESGEDWNIFKLWSN